MIRLLFFICRTLTQCYSAMISITIQCNMKNPLNHCRRHRHSTHHHCHRRYHRYSHHRDCQYRHRFHRCHLNRDHYICIFNHGVRCRLSYTYLTRRAHRKHIDKVMSKYIHNVYQFWFFSHDVIFVLSNSFVVRHPLQRQYQTAAAFLRERLPTQ